MLGSFSRAHGRLATTNVLSLKEPTLSCNQVRRVLVFAPNLGSMDLNPYLIDRLSTINSVQTS
jgi:hypothetical protein